VNDLKPNGTPTATVDAGSVRVGVRVATSVDDAWSALCDQTRVGQWFGDLDRPWRPGEPVRIDFGDGDFFDAITRQVVDHRLIEFEWRFLGAGQLNSIRWTTSAIPGGTEIVVRDTDPHRTPAEADQLTSGWQDFFGRLAHYLTTGERSRYEWRQDIDGSVDLPDGTVDPLAAAMLPQWLPIATDGFVPRWFFVVDEDGPRRFRVDDWIADPDKGLTFSIAIPTEGAATAPTSCTVSLDELDGVSRLRFTHTGWRELGLPERRSRLLRRRFATAWTAAIAQARELATRP
jgi:uncharacterized protein YndB with AHSA1/START domain